ncbi:hypothetical protein G6F65_017375 [Rhizopus arrhizus]|nr:hypothetical protein G6F65_017375 [Rhizopus arrhizus]
MGAGRPANWPAHQRRPHRAEAQAALFQRLGEQVAEGGAERAGEYEGNPEQDDPVDALDAGGQRGERDEAADQQRAAGEAQPGIVGEEIPQCGAERVGEQHGGPVEAFGATRCDVADRDRLLRQPPRQQHQCQAAGQQAGAGGVAQAKRAVEQVGHGGTGGAGGQHHRPEQYRVEAPRRQLHSQQAGEDGEQDGRAGHVAQVERHRQQVARGLAEGGGGYLHHPEAKGDRRHFAVQGICV